MKHLSMAILTAVLLLGAAAVSTAGIYHSGGTLLCYDCHTMHFSMSHTWDGTGSISTTPSAGGNWLGANGPNEYLLKAPANELCLSCHNGSAVAPDVLEANFNAGSPGNRSAGALNETGAAPYQDWKGHTLGSMATPPGFNGTYTAPSHGLECTQCHTQHGRAGAYRNLGPRSIPESALSFEISTTNNTSKNVWINIAGLTGTPGSRTPADWSNSYDTANIFYNRIESTGGTPSRSSSNGVSRVCQSCHADFHGSSADAGNIGGTGAPPEAFKRHPTAGVAIGAMTGGHSNLTGRYAIAANKVKVATIDYTNYTNSSPICQSCHKSHGNQNPFGLIFLNRAAVAVAVDEQGGWAAGQTQNTGEGLRNLCGQCHGQGN